MAHSGKNDFAIGPEEVLGRLSEIPFDASQAEEDDRLRRAELLHSVLAIAGLDHESESAMARQAVKNALGKLFEPGE